LTWVVESTRMSSCHRPAVCLHVIVRLGAKPKKTAFVEEHNQIQLFVFMSSSGVAVSPRKQYFSTHTIKSSRMSSCHRPAVCLHIIVRLGGEPKKNSIYRRTQSNPADCLHVIALARQRAEATPLSGQRRAAGNIQHCSICISIMRQSLTLTRNQLKPQAICFLLLTVNAFSNQRRDLLPRVLDLRHVPYSPLAAKCFAHRLI
jgi:hypothetical protein